MSSLIVKPPEDEHAYEMIEAAVMETSRGRWFLAEYARRHRHAETVTILEAIEKLQKSLAIRSMPAEIAQPALSAPAPSLPFERLQFDIIEMARAIARTEREIRAIQPDGAKATQFFTASDELDAVVSTTEQATSAILSSAERVQEFAWELRERSGKAEECDLLDACATEIYAACGFQDLTAQRIRKVVETLRFLDQRIKSLLDIAGLAEDFNADEQMIDEIGDPTENQPAARASDIWMSEAPQAEIDETFAFFTPAADVEPTLVWSDLLRSEAESRAAPVPADPFRAEAVNAAASDAPAMERPAAKAEAGPPGDSLALPESPYDSLSTLERLRAFR
jgi:chemotaxis regulatin CheY-phosphate phosphatase CheZ